MKRKPVAGVIIANRKPDGSKEEVPADDAQDHALIAAAEDFIRALNTKDSKMLAQAIRAAFEICEASPHHEGPHIEEGQE